MNLDRKSTLEIISKVSPGISTKGIIEETACIMMDGDYMITFNDRISIAHPYKTDFSCCIPAQEFTKTLQNAKTDDLEVNCSDKEMTLVNKKFRAGIGLVENKIQEALPIKHIDEIKWKVIPKTLLEGIEYCLFSVAKASSVPYLNCVAIKGNTIVSSDNFRVSLFTMDLPLSKRDILIPLTSAIELVKMKDVTHFALNDSWIYFKSKSGVFFFCRVVEAEFPDVEGMFEVSPEAVKIELPSGNLLEALEACSVFSDSIDVDIKVEINIEQGVLYCRSSNQKGWMEFSVDSTECPDLKFEVHPDFLKAVLGILTEVILDDNKMHIHAENFKHLVALC
jgi:DNA polymerase III sliding clamp (beta) subunit (PCNA family)